MERILKITSVLLFITAASSIVYAEPASWLIGEWYTYGTYKIDKDELPDDIVFSFAEDGTYHNKFYRNAEKNEGLILETKGNYTFTGGVEFNWERSHRWDGSQWVPSIKKGTFYIYRKGLMLELRTDNFIWLLERK